MFEQYLQQLNVLALVIAILAYWFLGMVWMIPGFMGNAWMKELKVHGVTTKKPEQKEMMGMMIGSIIYTAVVTFGVSYITFIAGTVNAAAAVKMGALLGVCFSFTTIGITYTWERRSMKNLLIDGGYHAMGIFLATVILSLWH
jgi:Protein of unknown function (DUF1761)